MSEQLTLWDEKKRQAMAAEAELPIKQHLRESIAENHAALALGLQLAVDTWEQRDLAWRCRAEARMKHLLDEILSGLANLHRPLPTTTICVCPCCTKVHLPRGAAAQSYQCRDGGTLWGHHRASNFRPLPFGFWKTAMPGTKVPKRILSEEQQEKPTGDDAA